MLAQTPSYKTRRDPLRLTGLWTIIVACGTSISSGQETTPSFLNGESGTTIQDAVSKVQSTLTGAFQGETEDINALLSDYLLPAAIALAILIAGYMIASFVGRMVGQLVARRVDLTLGKFFGKMTTNVIMILVLVGVLGGFGIDVTSFAAIIAAVGFAVGMALQGTLSNFASGVMLLVFRPFNVQDYIKAGDVEGIVEEIDLFTTKLNSPDNRHLIVPNSDIFGTVIVNYTTNPVRRVDVSVGTAYSADIRQTRRVLSDAIVAIPGAVQEPASEVFLVKLGDSSVDWQCRVWCRTENYWDVHQRVTAAAKDALDAANIGIPFPQLDLHVVSNVLNRAA